MHQNTNIKTLDVKPKKFFRLWLEFLKPYHRLANKEMEVVAYLLYKRHIIASKVTDPALIDDLLLNKDTRAEIKDMMGYSSNQVLSNTLYDLRQQNILIGNTITKLIIPNLESGSDNFKLVFNFNIHED